MKLPDWSHYKVVPESVLKEAIKHYYDNIDFYHFMSGGECNGYTQKLIRLARPNMSDKDLEDYDIDLSIEVLFN